MHRLFWKIFAWFWLATIVIVTGTAWSTAQLFRGESHRFEAWLRAEHRGRAEAAVALYQTRGSGALRAWLESMPHGRGRARHFLLDASGHDVLGRPVPPALRAPAGLEERALVSPVRATDGTPYRFVTLGLSRHPGPGRARLLRALRRPEIGGVRFGVSIVLSGLVCLWLAWYLTQPVRRLRAATEQIASGEFDVRVAEAIGGRRDEIADLGRDFDRMAERLQALLEAHRQLVSDVSHELRSPLARVQVALGLARQRSAGAIDAELDRIERECGVLNELIGQLLTLSRLQSERESVAGEGAPVDLAALIEAVAGDAAFEAREHECAVEVTQSEPAVVPGREELLRSALENVVRNAVRHTAAASTVEIALRRRNGSARITVRDHGPGVPGAQLARVFEPFVRVSEARERGSGGFGLGLAIAERALQLHGGHIEARNVGGGGLEVIMELPAGTVSGGPRGSGEGAGPDV